MTEPVRGVTAPDAPDVKATGGAGNAPAPADGVQARPTPAVDSADVSQAQALLETISAAADAIPPVNQARVAELQQAIAQGTYQVSPEAVAQKIVEIEKILTGTEDKKGG